MKQATVVRPVMIKTTQKTPRRTTPKNETQQDDCIVLPNLSTPELAQEQTPQPQITNITIKDSDLGDRRVMARRDLCVLYTVMTLLVFFCIANMFLTLYLYRSCVSCQQASNQSNGK